jgi:hypothetical protein
MTVYPPVQGSSPEPDRCHGAELLVWGAHGGAGTTTLAAWLGRLACDLGSMRPGTYPRYPAQIANGRPLVVVCGPTARSALAATIAVKAVTMAWSRVSVLAIVGDGWPEPATATIRFQLLVPQADAIIRVPFVPGMRLADEPSSVPLPRQARWAVKEILAAAGLPPLSPNVPDLPDRS